MAQDLLDCWSLCQLPENQLVYRFRQAAAQLPKETISEHLEEAVEKGGLPPHILTVWLSLNESIETLLASARHPSRNRRKHAIKRLGYLHSRHGWRGIWTSIGGIEGWLTLFKESSVRDVTLLINALRLSHKGNEIDPEKRQLLTELTKSLLPSIFPDMKFKSSDSRQLTPRLLRLLPVCDSETLFNTLDLVENSQSDTLHVHNDDLILRHHHDLCKNEVLASILQKDYPREYVKEWCQPFLTYHPDSRSSKFREWSASMEFALETLERLLPLKQSGMSTHDVVQLIVIPLSQKSFMRRKYNKEMARRVVELTTEYFEKHPVAIEEAAKSRTWLPALRKNLYRKWDRDPQYWEAALVRQMEVFRHRRTLCLKVNDCAEDLKTVSVKSRYRLLDLIGKHACSYKSDINNFGDLKQAAEDVWSYNVFAALNRNEALNLLDRIKLSTSEDPKVTRPKLKGVLAWSRARDSRLDMALYRILLRRGEQNAVKDAQEKVDLFVDMAKTSRDSTERIWNANAAFIYAIASTSLELCQKFASFSRRFLKDPEGWNSLFNSENLLMDQHLGILTGKYSLQRCHEFEDFRRDIGAANIVLDSYLSTGLQALREPFFLPHFLAPIFKLHKKILSGRSRLAARIKSKFSLSDAQVLSFLWKYTGETYLVVELKMLENAPWLLSYNNHRTGDHFDWEHSSFIQVTPVEAQFVDKLAMSRDELWKNHRTRSDPELTTLQDPWPQGLPVHCHTPPGWFDIDAPKSTKISWKTSKMLSTNVDLPYLSSRAEKVVFMSASQANGPFWDEEYDTAVLDYEEKYNYCLALYVLSAPATERRARLIKAWDHAIRNLSKRFSSSEESHTFWKPIFELLTTVCGKREILDQLATSYIGEPVHHKRSLPPMVFWRARRETKPRKGGKGRTPPPFGFHFPEKPDFNTLNEWDPEENAIYPPKPREVSFGLTALDRILGHNVRSSPEKRLEGQLRLYPRWEPPELNYSEHREALIAVVLLLQDMKIAGAAHTLRNAFPDQNKFRRYPPLLLDAEFVAKTPLVHFRWDDGNQKFRRSVPSQLIRGIVRDGLEKLKDQEPSAITAETNNATLNCLKLLARGERLDLALDFVLEIVSSSPHTSSWHRHLLNQNLLRSLPTTQVSSLISKFVKTLTKTNALRARGLESLKSAGLGDEDFQKASEKLPLVKITTMKALAEVLNDTEILETQQAIGFLEEMIEEFTHKDVQYVLLNSLMSMAKSIATLGEPPEEEWHNIFAVLRRVSVPLGSLSEKPTTSNGSESLAISHDHLPEIDRNSPMWDQFTLMASDDAAPKRLQSFLVKEIMLPALDKSIETNKQWLSAFARKYGVNVDLNSLPISPIRAILSSAPEKLRWAAEKEASTKYVDMYFSCANFLIDPPTEILDISDKTRREINPDNSKEVLHWLNYVPCRGRESSVESLTETLYDLLTRSIQSEISLDIEYIETKILETADKALELEQRGRESWNILQRHHLDNLGSLKGYDTELNEEWNKVAQRMSNALLGKLRMYRRAQMSRRMEDIRGINLPDTLDLQISLIRLPGIQWVRGKEYPHSIDNFILDYTAVLWDYFLNNPGTSYKKFDKFEAVFWQLNFANVRATAMTRFSAVDLPETWRTTVVDPSLDAIFKMVRLDLARQTLKQHLKPTLLQTLQEKNPQALKGLKIVVGSWRVEPNDEVRNWGTELWRQAGWDKEANEQMNE